MNASAVVNTFRWLTKTDRIELHQFGTRGTVLLSYLTLPWRVPDTDPRWYSHSNLWECKEMAETWLRAGYDVDVIDWDNYWFVPDKPYSVFIDIHSNMERISPLLPETCKKVLHATGSHWWFQNSAELTRLRELYIRRGIGRKEERVLAKRLVPKSDAISHVDYVTILGNKTTWGTFKSTKPVFYIPGSTTTEYPWIDKDFKAVKKNFLWFGSNGAVQKGLDLVLEAFAVMPDYNLTVAGPVDKEKDFAWEYREELHKTLNIRTVGYIDIRSREFANILASNTFLIYPTSSEGQSGSVITCMHGGLIPVVSRFTGVDIGDNGFVMDDCGVSSVLDTIRTVSGQPASLLSEMAMGAWNYARTHHTRHRFSAAYTKACAVIDSAVKT